MPQRQGSKAAPRHARIVDHAAAGASMYPGRLSPVARATRLALALALATLAAACGGGHGHSDDSYRHAMQAEAQCCEHLAGGPRDQCLGSLVKVQDPAVAQSTTNQATFECVEDHFECNETTGRATRASAQAQLDCIQDLDP